CAALSASSACSPGMKVDTDSRTNFHRIAFSRSHTFCDPASMALRITLIPTPYETHKYTRRAMLRDFQRVFMNLRGLATVIYPTPDLARAKDWYAKAFGFEPYFDQPFYVGFEIAGYELGLLPD